MRRVMKFNCMNEECGEFDVIKEYGQGYAENKICYFRTDYYSREEFQKALDEMCTKCMNGTLSFRHNT